LVKIKEEIDEKVWKRVPVFKKVTIDNSEISVIFSTKLSILDKAFRDFFISYAKSIYKAYGRTGALFQQGYKKKLVDSESYLKYLIQYIHNNPVEAGLCKKPGDWKYSSYSMIINEAGKSEINKFILELFGGKSGFENLHLENGSLKKTVF
jgi:REP element-mobilizing transposase RayT